MLLYIKSHLFIPLIFGFLALQAAIPGGLKFQGSEQPINKRTSYDVFGEKTPTFSDHFNIEFNLALYPTTKFGYIVRIKNNESNRIYNLFYDGQGDNLTFRFNEEGKSNLIIAVMEKEDLLNMQWFRVAISFNLKSDSIQLTVNNSIFGTGGQALPDAYSPIVLFGRSDHIIDVPSFAIKDLSIGNEDKYIFALKESKGNIAHDIRGRAFGKLTNPEWLLNDAYHWRHKASFRSQSVAGANYNPVTKEVYYFNSDSLHIYDARSGDTQIKVFDKKNPVKPILGTNFIDTERNKLYSYELYYATPNDNYDGPTVARLDLDTYQWTAETSEQLTSPLHHHGSYYDPSSRRFTIFGGFGNMHYSKNFFSYDLDASEWNMLQGFTGDPISPRYFSSVGYLAENNSIYIFGGMGNESGEQVVGRKYYYDLHKVDLNTKRISRLWEIPWEEDNVVPVRGMVVLNDSSFYTLCYPEHFSQSFLKLYRFSLSDGGYEILGDSIPIHSDKITTNANLYYDSGLSGLLAVIQEFDDDISSNLKVYSLAFPPITADALNSYPGDKDNNALAIILISVSLVTGAGYLLFRKLKPEHRRDADAIRNAHMSSGKTETATRPNSIYLFGDFAVRSRKNRDITYMFSEQLKQIFCLILQYSTTDDGIASQRLSSMLWPDKPPDKAKNSRGVTLNHLRKALGELDGIELIHEKGYFKIVQTEKSYCDYTRCLEIITRIKVDEHTDELTQILARGKFLHLSDHPLFDSFKEEVEKRLEPVLLVEIEKSFAAELYQTTIALADALFNIDPLNDLALTFQIKAMQKLKMADEARIRYQAFIIEYRKITGNDYPVVIKV